MIHTKLDWCYQTAIVIKDELIQLGFQDDQLVERGLTFDPQTAEYHRGCPLIGIHMSQKISINIGELKAVSAKLAHIMMTKGRNEVGYSHCEFTELDATIVPEKVVFEPRNQFPCRYVQSKPRLIDKKWGIHLSMEEASVPCLLREILERAGLYYLVRWKTKGGRAKKYAVFTIQGINDPSHGRELYGKLLLWLIHAGGSEFEIKFEITTEMIRYNNPKVVPPTIECIDNGSISEVNYWEFHHCDFNATCR